ncbi:MAG TPA: phosphate ABC transporter substrate-binding protein PstS [Glaciihabitans sp.]|jgi:phosphate transport system substrate-binding protein|nr:phosphate ABC transporter substrate-binding protein PstS [Glaciihabitans sp.]
MILRQRRRSLTTALAVVTTAAVLSGCAVNEQGDTPSDLFGTIDAAGSSAQSAAQDVWISNFQRQNAGVTINYDPSGSGAGREQFLGGGVDFAGSDSALSEEELAGEFLACAEGSQAIDLPVYVSPLVLVFNVEGLDTLRLDGASIAGIFAGTITRWNDPALVALNDGAALPDAAITAVHRSDDSGTTKNFTDYLFQNAPDVWPYEASDTFPVGGGEAAQGNSGVINAVSGGVNTIGYADASRAEGLDVAELKVGSEFVAYSAEAAAAIIDASPLEERENPNDIVVNVDRTSQAAGVYPLVLVSYLIACEQYTNSEVADVIKAYLTYVATDGQQDAADSAGSAALSAEFSEKVLASIETIQ